MMNRRLKKFGDQLGFTQKKNAIYGVYEGLMFTLRMNASKLPIVSVNVYFPTEGARGTIYMALQNKDIKKSMRIRGFAFDGNSISAVISPQFGSPINYIRTYMEWIASQLKQCSALGVTVCSVCGMSVEAGNDVFINDVAQRAHAGCVESVIIEAENQRTENIANNNSVGGFFGAILGALIGAIPWIIAIFAGWFISALGLVIGLGANFGYVKFGGKPSKSKIWVILFAIVLSVTLSQVVSDLYYVGKALSENGYTINISSLLNGFLLCLSDHQFLSSSLGNFFMGLLFAGLGILSVIRKIVAEIRVKKVEKIQP